jgi:uncharacterized membrane protein HdeD (DUF308 family)
MATVGQVFEAIGELPRYWWLVALRGLAAIIFGILAFIWPGATLTALVWIFGTYAIADGVLALYAATRSRGQHTWASVLEGIVSIAAGLIAFFSPTTTALALFIVIAVWAIVTGVMEVIAAVDLRHVIPNEWFLLFSGLLSVLVGVVLLVQPGAGALAIVWVIGFYAVLFGIGMLAFAWRLRGLHEHMAEVTAPVSQPRPV